MLPGYVDEALYGDRDLPTPEEIEGETAQVLEQDIIRYHAVTDASYGIHESLFRVDSALRQDAAEHFGRCFHREIQHDFAPYRRGDESDDLHVLLLRSGRLLRTVPIAAGAVEMKRVRGLWVLTWIWIHPWDRGDRHPTTKQAFDALDAAYGEFSILGPISEAMRSLMKKRGYEDRLVVRR